MIQKRILIKKNIKFKNTIISKLFLFFLLTSFTTLAQNTFEDINNVAEDLVFLSGQFISPAAKAAVYQSSGGWYTSAKKKELWDVEFSIQGNALLIPGKFNRFFVDETKLKNLKVKGDETVAYLPTALGNDEFVVMEGTIGSDTFEFDSPEGINDGSIKHAQLQLALGLWKGTTIIGRYSPEIKINEAKYKLYGFGLLHSLSQWMPKLDQSSYNLSLLATYSKYNIGDEFNEVDLRLGTLNSILVDGETFSYNVLASKAFGNFDFSAAIGITKSNFDYTVGGDGDLILDILNEALGGLDGDDTAFKADLGVNYKIKNFSINSMLTFGRYSNVVFGVNYNL